MTKKQKIVKDYLKENVDFKRLQELKDQSWLKNKPVSWLFGNGIAFSEFYQFEKEAIELAEYKNPNSDRTWNTVQAIREQLILENIK